MVAALPGEEAARHGAHPQMPEPVLCVIVIMFIIIIS